MGNPLGKHKSLAVAFAGFLCPLLYTILPEGVAWSPPPVEVVGEGSVGHGFSPPEEATFSAFLLSLSLAIWWAASARLAWNF